MIELDFRLAVIAIPGIAPSLGSRVYPAQLPQDVIIPAIVYDISERPGRVYKGLSSVRNAKLTYDVHAGTYLAARNLAGKIQDAAEADLLNGTFGNSKIVEVNVSELTNLDEPDTVPGLTLHRVRVEMSVWYQEA